MAKGSIDTLVIGAGHNGLIAATYLAKAGRKVLVLERSERAGGILRGSAGSAPRWSRISSSRGSASRR